MQEQSTATCKKKSASRKTKFDKSSVVTVEDGKQWLANKPFEKAPVQRTNSSDSVESLSSKLQGTVQARKQWLASAFADGGASSDSFDSSHQWEAATEAQRTQTTEILTTSESDASESDESLSASSEASLNHLSLPSLAECGVPEIEHGDSSLARQELEFDFDSEPMKDIPASFDEARNNDSGLTTSRYSQERVCAKVVQAALRGYMVRCHLRRRKEAAIKIETQVRRVQAQCMYELKLFAVVLLQAWIRGWMVRTRHERAHAVVLLQAVARGWLARSCLERSFAAVLAQSVIRGWLARKRFQHTTRDLLVLHQQASIIQAQWRLFQTLSVYELQRFAIVFLQSAMRGWLVRRRIAKSCASVMVQSAFRGWRVRRQLVSASRQECASSATLIQSHWKRYQAQSLYELQSFAIVLLQSVFRVFLVQKRLEKRYASALIQSLVRGWLARRQLEQTFAASFLQSMARGWLIRKRLNAQQEEERSIAERRRLHDISIILIQSQWRRFQAQSMYEIQLLAVVVIQSVVRVFLVQKGLEKTFAAALLQSVVRGWLVRMRLEKTFASALIQSVVRGWLARKKFFALRQQATAFVEHKEAAIVLIQASWRRSKAHFLYNSRLRAIVVIQSVVRVFVVLKQLERTFAAALLQSVTRGWLERRQLEKRIAAAFNARRRENSALVIQRQWRMYRAQTMYELQTYAIVFLQSVIRGFQARRAIQTHQLALLVRSVRVMQRWIRSHLNRCKERQSSAATLIQARWRGSIEKEAYKFYQLMLRSVIVVQVAWREYRIKKARNGRTPSASPNRDNIRRQFLFNSSYSLESVVPSSPSSVTVFTSGEYSAVYASSEISAAQRHDTHSTVVAHCDRREPARITLDMSNPKSRLAPILTCFGSDRGLPKNLSTSQDLVEAAATIQEAWRTCIARLSYQRKLTSIKMIQSFIRSAKSFRPNQRVSLIDRKELTPKSSAHDDFKRPFEAFQESCRSPSKAVIQLRRCSLLQSTKAPVLTWF